MDKKGGITIFRRKFFVSQCRRFSWGNHSVFQKISGLEKIRYMKGVLLRFCVGKIFCLILPENFVEGPSLVEKIAGFEIFLHNRGYHDFPSNILRLTVPKNFVGDPSVFYKFSSMKKLWIKKGVSRFSVGSFLSHSAEDFRGGTILCFRKFLVWRKLGI